MSEKRRWKGEKNEYGKGTIGSPQALIHPEESQFMPV